MTWDERLKAIDTQTRSMTDAELIAIVTGSAIGSAPGAVPIPLYRAARAEIVRRWIKEHKER